MIKGGGSEFYNVLINVFCKWYIWGLQCINKCVLQDICLGFTMN